MPAKSAELTIGRTFGVTLEDGDEFFTSLKQFCVERGVRFGYIPMFIGAFRRARVVGTCDPHEAEATMFDASVELSHVETVGAGTLAWDFENEKLLPHVHLSLG